LIACATLLKEVAHRHGEAVMEWIIFAVVVIGISVELLRIVHHLDLFRAHMTYQVHRKTGSPLHSKLIKPQGVILLTSCLALTTLLWRRHVQPELGTAWDVLPMAAVTLGMLIYAVIAGEITGNVYSLSVGPALVLCLVSRDFHENAKGAGFPIFPQLRRVA